jgi:ABC-2 type transport system permease protein
MGQIFAMMRKELRLWAQKPGSWIVVFVVPLLFIWIMQAVFGSSGTPVVTVYAVNQDLTPESERVMSALRSSQNLEIEVLPTREEADRRVGAGERMAAIIVPPGFAQNLTTEDGARIQIIIDPARAEQANILIGLVNAALGPIMVDAEVTRGVSAGVNQVLEGLQSSQQPGQPLDMNRLRNFFTSAINGVVSNQVQAAMEDPQIKLDVQSHAPNALDVALIRPPSLLDYLVPGYSLMFMFFLISNLAVTVVEEKQTGTLRRLLVAPLPRSRILLGKMLPYFLIGVVQFVFVLLASKLIFGIDLGSSWVGLAIIIIASALAMAAMGVLVAAFAQSEGQADGLAIVLVLSMAIISGAMFPTIQIPGLQVITPHYWAMQGFLNVISRGMGAEGALMPAGVLLTMAAVFFTIGAIRFRFE